MQEGFGPIETAAPQCVNALEKRIAATRLTANSHVGGEFEGYPQFQFQRRLERSSLACIKQRHNYQYCQQGTKNCKRIDNHNGLHSTCFKFAHHCNRTH